MEEVEPGASVWPTLVRLDITQAGKEEADCCTPVPERETVAGELVALLATEMLPVTLPEAVGSKLAFKEADCPGARVVPEATPLALKLAPETVTPEIVTLEFPLLVSVTARVLPEPTFTFPKFKLVGFAPSRALAAFTVRVAAPLVKLLTEFLTDTVNCAPVSVLAVAGVV
jgi:hypothetical protein